MNKVAKIFSAATVGLDSYLVEVSVDERQRLTELFLSHELPVAA